ncbi:MAG TPA: BamA/TamA family outer membrane protein [Bryobacteraceae bacterium]|nr:BamA/TamA family outer membrane protein [Bryobacteraceae bacterium]
MRCFPVLLFLFLPLRAWPQTAGTRTAEIEKAREEKARHLIPDTVSKLEAQLRRFRDEKYPERFTTPANGWGAKVGGMVTGSGFAFGPQYRRRDFFDGRLWFRGSAQISIRGSFKLQNEWVLPHLARDKAYVSFTGSHHNYNQINYYGPGPDSEKTGRSNYRLENTNTELLGAIRPGRHFKLGIAAGYLWMNVGPGSSDRFISAEKQYPPPVTPGIDRQTNYLRNAVFIQHDTRDNPGGPKRGGNYLFQYTWFDDRKLNGFNFRRMDAEIQQFIPFFNHTRVFGFRAKTVLTEGNETQSAPFYLMPVLGGSDDLRGYRPFRFSDRNSFVMNAEYRWQVFDGMDGAVFADAGKVFPRRGQLNLSNLESSVGFGLRFNIRNSTFLRIDTGFSHEGFQVWIKFDDVFAQRAFGAALAQPVY